MIRTTGRFTVGPGTPYYTAFYYGGSTEGECAAAATATSELFDALEALTVNDLSYTRDEEISVVDPATGNTTAVFLEAATFHTGTVTGAPSPWASQALIRWRTGVYIAGREIRGRTFWPAPPQSNVINGVLENSYLAALAGIAQDHLDNPNTTAAGAAVIWSPTHAQAAAINQVSIWSELAVMRSRRD